MFAHYICAFLLIHLSTLLHNIMQMFGMLFMHHPLLCSNLEYIIYTSPS